MSKTFTLTITADNAAFEDEGCEQEIARILRRVADKMESGAPTSGYCMDINGNKVGQFELVEDE